MVTEVAGERSYRRRAAHGREKKICGSVVAERDGCGAKFTDGHAGSADTFFGSGRIGDEFFLCETDNAIELLFVLVHAEKNGAYDEKFESAAHGEALLRTMPGGGVGGSVEDGYAETASGEWFESGKGFGECGPVGGLFGDGQIGKGGVEPSSAGEQWVALLWWRCGIMAKVMREGK